MPCNMAKVPNQHDKKTPLLKLRSKCSIIINEEMIRTLNCWASTTSRQTSMQTYKLTTKGPTTWPSKFNKDLLILIFITRRDSQFKNWIMTTRAIKVQSTSRKCLRFQLQAYKDIKWTSRLEIMPMKIFESSMFKTRSISLLRCR